MSSATLDRGWAARWLDEHQRPEGGRLAGSRAPEITKHQLADLRRSVEQDDTIPTRGWRVIAYLDAAEKPVERNRQDKRRANRRRSAQKLQERRRRWVEANTYEKDMRRRIAEAVRADFPEADAETLDALIKREAQTRAVNRLVEQEQERAPDEDGPLKGLLTALARLVVPTLLSDFRLPESERAALEHWVVAKCGDVLRCQDGIDASIAGYLAWREASLRQVAEPATDTLRENR